MDQYVKQLQKVIVTPQWLQESAKQGRLLPYGHYAALSQLHSNESEETRPHDKPASDLHRLPIVKPTNLKVFQNWNSRYACARASPLICLNQKLVSELGILSRSRELEGSSINALAYDRAVAVCIAVTGELGRLVSHERPRSSNASFSYRMPAAF